MIRSSRQRICGRSAQPAFPLHPELVGTRPELLPARDPRCICSALSVLTRMQCLLMLGCDSVHLSLQCGAEPTLVPLVLSFLLIFRDHTELKRAKTAVNILMDNTVYEHDSCSYRRDLGQFHM